MKQTKQKCTLTYYSPLLSVASRRQNKNDLGRVSAKTNENSNSNDNSLKSFRHWEKKLVRARHVSRGLCQGDFQRSFAQVIVALSSNLDQEVQCF